MVLAIVGDVTSDEAFAAAERVFGGWPRGEMPAAARSSSRRRRRAASSSSTSRTRCRPRFASGSSAIPRKHQDYLAWDLAVKILGGEGANRLHRVLRSERGLTYGAAADTEARKQAGDFVAETDTRTETTGEALRLMVDEISQAAARAGVRARAVRRAGLSGRQLPADHRDARTRSRRRC